MKITSLIIILFSSWLSGCASTTFGPRVESNNAWHAVAYLGIAIAIENQKVTTNNCATKDKDSRQACEQQVATIKNSIAKAKTR
ncbi:hypothetical protein A9Q98_02810 [Thalassotalea sp. 42_200_T64]|nr:hypothetical protein A9Q98_02810 [Thalassotalea sp. 42_200_T64]